MKKRSLRLGCVVAGLLAVILLALGGGAWWFFIGQYTTAAVAPASPVQVYLLSPASGDEVATGDFVSVNLQALAPEAISWSEVFVDGISLGALTESPERASWTWQAWPAGIHVLTGRAQAADGQMGESQTLIVNVIAVNDAMQVTAGPYETLAQVGAKFGVPPVQMAGANPKIDPSKPLADGQPVNVPTGGGGGSGKPQPPGGGNGPGSGNVPFLIEWELHLTGQVDKSYCYLSDGGGAWDKMPKQPFEFFGGLDNLYTQVFDVTPPSVVTVQAQCWGWLGGVLTYLGQAEAKSAGKSPVQLIGDGFQLIGKPNWPDGNAPQADVVGPQVPPPYALRETEDATDCFAHKGTLSLCKQAIGVPLKTKFLLVWEWQPGANWPGQLAWLNTIKGYRLYEIDPVTKAQKLLQEVSPAAKKITLLPLPWGPRCYGVEAVHSSVQYGVLTSAMNIYCPGMELSTEKVVLKPAQWMTTGGTWAKLGCENAGGLDAYVDANNKTGFGYKPGQVMVGSIITDDEEVDCFLQYNYTAAVKFAMPTLPAGAIVQKAELRFSSAFKQYFANGLSTNYKLACAGGWGVAAQDWSGLVNALHFKEPNSLKSAAYNKPLDSLSEWDDSPEVDVTWQAADWLQQPSSNHGFILNPRKAPHPSIDGYGECLTGYDNFELEIDYFTP